MQTSVNIETYTLQIPHSDARFLSALVKKMGWDVYKTVMPLSQEVKISPTSWADEFIGKWQDKRSTEQMLQDIHDARTANDNMTL